MMDKRTIHLICVIITHMLSGCTNLSEEDPGIGLLVSENAVSVSAFNKDAGMLKDASTYDPDAGMTYDTNVMHPFGMTREDIISGEREKELARLQDMYREYYNSMEEKEDLENLTKSIFPNPSYHNFQTILPLSWSGGSSSPVTDGFQRAYRYLGNSADDNDPNGWFDLIQGVTNDGNYWYFSKNQDEGDNSRIFKVDYDQNLNSNFTVYDYWSGQISDCDHFGDIDYYDGLIIVGAEGCSDNHARFGFFKASTLDLLAYVEDENNVLNDSRAPWVAVRNGRLFSSKGGSDVEVIHEWEVDWDLIPSSPPADELDYDDFVLSHKTHGIDNITYTGGWDEDELHYIQGGDFSSDGTIFYALVGYCDSPLSPCDCSPRQIYAFRYYSNDDWWLLKASSYTAEPFKYAASGCDEEPEGITYYDTNDLSGYGTSKKGEVIAELVNWDVGDDNAWIKHYTSIIDVNPQDGIDYALYDRWNNHGAWDHSILELEAGTYEESLNISKDDFIIKMVSTGTATIHP